MSNLTLGCCEIISIPELGLHDIVAKVDTGAYSGAIHCTNIRIVRRGPNKQRVLKFTPLGKAKLATETTKFSETYVRSAFGHRVKRYIIPCKLELREKTYNVHIGLSDRSDMRKEVLLGRRFIRENDMVVDVRINQEYDDELEMNS